MCTASPGAKWLLRAPEADLAPRPLPGPGAVKACPLPAQWEVGSWSGKVHGVPAWDHHRSPNLFWKIQRPTSRRPGSTPAPRRRRWTRPWRYAERLNCLAPDGQIARLGLDPLVEAGAGLLGYWTDAYEVLPGTTPGRRSSTWSSRGWWRRWSTSPGCTSYPAPGTSPSTARSTRLERPQRRHAPGRGVDEGEQRRLHRDAGQQRPRGAGGGGLGPHREGAQADRGGSGHFNCLSQGAPEAAPPGASWSG